MGDVAGEALMSGVHPAPHGGDNGSSPKQAGKPLVLPAARRPFGRSGCRQIPSIWTRILEAHDLRSLVRLDAPPVRPPMTRARLSGRTPSLSSASAVPSP